LEHGAAQTLNMNFSNGAIAIISEILRAEKAE